MDCLKTLMRLIAAALFIATVLSGCLTPVVGESAPAQERSAADPDAPDAGGADRTYDSQPPEPEPLDIARVPVDRTGAAVRTDRLGLLDRGEIGDTPRSLPDTEAAPAYSFGRRSQYALRSYEAPPKIVDESLLEYMLSQDPARSPASREPALSARRSAAARADRSELRARSDLREIAAQPDISSRTAIPIATGSASQEETVAPADAAPEESQESETLHPVDRFAASRPDTDDAPDPPVEPDTIDEPDTFEEPDTPDIPDQPIAPFDPIYREAARHAQSDTELVLSPGERTEISLPGRGWMFTGELGNSNAVELVDRSLTSDSTEFTLRLSPDAGEQGDRAPFSLRFELQDPAVAASEEHIVSIFSDEADVFPGDESVPADDDTVPGSVAETDDVSTDEGDDQRRYEPDHFSDYSDDELVALFEEAIGNPDIPRARAILDELRSRGRSPGRDLLADGGAVFRDHGYYPGAKDAFRFWVDRHAGERRGDEVHFSLAELYEEEQTTASLRRSARHYDTVASDYPRSTHAQTAASRARRLSRHFVDIR